jgi:hypothetical protein
MKRQFGDQIKNDITSCQSIQFWNGQKDNGFKRRDESGGLCFNLSANQFIIPGSEVTRVGLSMNVGFGDK